MTRVQAIRAEPTSMRLDLDNIGGGRVMRPFRMGGELIKAGTDLTAEFIKAINPVNRSALIGRFISVWPKPPSVGGLASPSDGVEGRAAERHVVALGFGRYDVIEGVKVNDAALGRSEAYQLAGKPEPEVKQTARAK